MWSTVTLAKKNPRFSAIEWSKETSSLHVGPSIVVLRSYLDIIMKPRTAPSTAILVTPACIYSWDKCCRNLQYSISFGQDEEDVCRFTSISFTFDTGEVSLPTVP